MRLSKASCCSLWLSVNTATSHNLLWFFVLFRQAPPCRSPSQAALTEQVTGRSPTQPQDCGQSPVFRRPAKHLQTTADFRLGRQVTLAQPKASSQGYRPKRADRSSNPGQGPWLQWQPQTLVSLQVFRRPAKHLQTTADSRLGASGYFRSSQSLATLGQPGSTRSRPLVAAYTGQVTDRSPTQPRNCGQSPVLRRPAKHLQTTADFRLGRQVTLAQPSASS